MATEATTETSALAAAKRKEFTRSMIELAGMLPVLVVICILFAVLTPNFLTQNNLVNVIRQASINIVLAAGMTFVILTGGIDLAVGSVLGFTAVIAVVVSLIPALGWAAVPAALFAAPRWEEQTGAHVNITKIPIDTFHQEIFADLKGPGQYDAYQTAAWFYGDFFTSDEPAIVEIAPFLKDPKYPYWDSEEFLPAMKRLYTWQGKLYGVLFDADAQILYYRKDVLGNADYQEKFKSKLGYDLPNPPKTMKEMHDVASFFTGWDWNGDGKDDWGISLHAKVNVQGFFHFLTLAAPYVVSPNNKYFYFNPDDMKPLINSEGHLRALEDYVKFLANGPKEQIGWTLPEGWTPFLSGHAVMEPTWGDLPTLAQDRARSSVQGRVGATIIPGTTEAFNPLTNQWEKSSLNTVGNTNGGTWHCVISRKSKQKEAAYDFLAFMANKKNAFFNVTNGWTGVQPAMKYEYFPPVGTGKVEQWENQGWDKADAIAYLNAYYANLVLPAQQIYLRIPGAAEYWHELDVRVSTVLSGATKPKEALDDIYQAWEQITDRYGRGSQKKLYAESYGAS